MIGLSAQLDSSDGKEDEYVGLLFVVWPIYAVIVLFCVLVQSWLKGVASSGMGRGIGELLFNTIVGTIAMIVTIIPYAIGAVTYIFVATSLFLAGLLCLPRALVFLTTSHPLRGAWKRGKDKGLFDATAVVDNLGKPSLSPAHARAMLLDSIKLKDEVKKREVALRVEKERLSKSILDDTQRMQEEREISRLMAESDRLNTQIEILKKGQKEFKQ